MTTSVSKQQFILQICHSHAPPFDDCARQYASLFEDTPYGVVTVFLTGKPDDEVTKTVASDKVIYLNYPTKALKGLKRDIIGEIKAICSRYAFAFSIAHRTKPTYVALMATDLHVLSIHHAFNDFSRWGRRMLARFFHRRLTLVGVSNAVVEDIKKAMPFWPDSRIKTLYNHIDLATLRAEQLDKFTARSELGLPETATIIANVGRLHPDKDQKTLIAAFAQATSQLHDAYLVIVGKGKLENALRSQASACGIADKVIFTGQIKNARRFFRAFDLFVLSSDHEPFGMVLLEAMAAEVPVICSDCGGGAEVVTNAGQLFPLGDAEALAHLLANRDKWMASHIRLSEHIESKFSDKAARQQFFDTVLPEELKQSGNQAL
jgi:glycosyltransferase involved in cell wall biosynthesis